MKLAPLYFPVTEQPDPEPAHNPRFVSALIGAPSVSADTNPGGGGSSRFVSADTAPPPVCADTKDSVAAF